MPDYEHLHLLLSGASLALSAGFFLLIANERASSKLLKFAMILIPICSSAYVLLLGKNIFQWDADTRTVLRLLAALGVYFLWLAVRLLFDDQFTAEPKHALPLLAIISAALAPALQEESGHEWGNMGSYGIVVVAMLLAMHILWILLSGKADDLDESRRRMRPIMTGVGALYILTMTLGRIAGASLIAARYFDLIGLAVLVAIKLTVVVKTRGTPNPIGLILNPEPAGLARTLVAEIGGKELLTDTSQSIQDREQAETERRMARELSERIRFERLYADCTLSLSSLAVLIALPEYRIRQLINRVLGFRNFSVFLNSYRLDEAVIRLNDPAQAKLPILSIALDTGFGSIGPFNRSFKERFGLTPSEFRQLLESERVDIIGRLTGKHQTR